MRKGLRRIKVFLDYYAEIIVKSRPDLAQAILANNIVSFLAARFLRLNENDEEYNRIFDFANDSIANLFEEQDVFTIKLERVLNVDTRGFSRYLFEMGSFDNEYFTISFQIFILNLDWLNISGLEDLIKKIKQLEKSNV